MRKQYDIFISYRRDNGEDKARILNQFLSTVGYRVFFDHESGMTGDFETEILAAVEIAPVFLMLMTPHCFDRCNEEGDWVRRELERAMVFGKLIIPIRPNYDDSMFKDLPMGIPECVSRLSKLEFAEIDFHKNFKSSAGTMVEEQIKKLVQPSIALVNTGNTGAKIHFFSDISCRVLHFGEPIAVTDASDRSVGAVARLLKGRHKLEYKSIEHEADAYSEVYDVPDNDYETFVNIELQPIKDKRKKLEEELKAEEERKAAEEKARREKIKKRESDAKYKYDFFFCYARQDASIVRQVHHFLSNAGYRCWIDTDSTALVAPAFGGIVTVVGLLAGLANDMILSKQAIDAVSKSKCLLFFSSEYSNNSEFAKKEIKHAVMNNQKVLLIRLDDTPIAEEIAMDLGGEGYLNLGVESREDIEKLLESIKQAIEKD